MLAPETFVAGVDFITRQPVTPFDQIHRNLVTLDAANREMLNPSPGWVRDFFLNQKDVALMLVKLNSVATCSACIRRGRWSKSS